MKATRINKNNLSKYVALYKEYGILISEDGVDYSINSEYFPIITDNKITISLELSIL